MSESDNRKTPGDVVREFINLRIDPTEIGDTEFFAQIAAAVLAHAAPKWMPIKSAPTTGEMFMWGYWRGDRFSIGLSYGSVSHKNMDAYGKGEVSRFATHWMPLPNPPYSDQ